MGKVMAAYTNGFAGEVTRSADNVIVSLKNTGTADIPFGAPVFLSSDKTGVVGFNTGTPQTFAAFVGFAVRVADKTPETYPSGQFGANPQGVWKGGQVIEVLTRGCIALPLAAEGGMKDPVYIRKSDGKLTTYAGESGTTVLLENVRIRRPRDGSGCCEALVTERLL